MTNDGSWEKYPWVQAYLQRLADFFWMGDWDIKIQVKEIIDDSNGTMYRAHARCEAIWSYRMATIIIDREFWEQHFPEPSKPAELTLIHEYLHAVLSGLGHAMNTVYQVLQVTGGPYKENTDTVTYNIYRDQEEYLVSQLTYAFHEAIGPAEPVDVQEDAA